MTWSGHLPALSSQQDPDELRINVAALLVDIARLRDQLIPKKSLLPAIRWKRTVRALTQAQVLWAERGWISPGAFEDAVVLLARRARVRIEPDASIASLLLAVTTDLERQQRSVWSKGLQFVLDRDIKPITAANSGLTKTTELGLAHAAKMKRKAEKAAKVAAETLARQPATMMRPRPQKAGDD